MLEKNPASRVHLFNADNKVEHYLDDGELERLLRVLKEESPRHRNVRLICLFLLSTGARLNEALRARWQDVDRGNRVWRIPAQTSKSKRVRSVPRSLRSRGDPGSPPGVPRSAAWARREVRSLEPQSIPAKARRMPIRDNELPYRLSMQSTRTFNHRMAPFGPSSRDHVTRNFHPRYFHPMHR